MHILCLSVDELVTLCETTLAKVLALDVPSDSDLVVWLLEFLFYDLLLLNLTSLICHCLL